MNPMPALAFLSILAAITAFGQTPLVTVNQAQRYQTIHGWETVDTHWDDFANYPAFKNAMDSVFSYSAEQQWLTRVRFEIEAGFENNIDYWTPFFTGQQPRSYWGAHRHNPVNDNSDPFTIDWNGFKMLTELDWKVTSFINPMRQQYLARGRKLFINLNYTWNHGTFLHQREPEEYAEFILAVYLYLDSVYGFIPDALEPKLEPDFQTPQGTEIPWTPQELAACIDAAVRRLKQYGFDVKIIAPSVTNPASVPAYFDEIVKYPEVIPHLYELSYHRYWVGADNGVLPAIKSRSENYNIGAAMLEWWTTENGFKVLQDDLKLGNNSAWQFGGPMTIVPAGPWGGGACYFVDTAAGIMIEPGPRQKYIGHYYGYIHPGAVRVEAQSTNGSFDPLAFKNSDSTMVVVVKASGGGSVRVGGLPGGTYAITMTTGDGINPPTAYDVRPSDQVISSGGELTANIPAAGVITLYQKPAGTILAPRRGASANVTALKAFPNPFSRSATLSIPPSALPANVRIFDPSGRMIREIPDLRDPGFVFEAEGLPAGQYFIRARHGKRILEGRVFLTR